MNYQPLTVFVIGLLVFVIAEGILIAILGARLRQSAQVVRQQREELARLRNASLDPARILAAFVKRSNAFDDQIQFVYRFRQGKATLKEAHDVIQVLLEDMATIWELRSISEFGTQVRYDPTQYRSNPQDKITKGTTVCVIEPGWRVGSQMIKYPLVKQDGGK